MKKANPYRAAGTFDGVSYIERDADIKLYDAIEDNQRYPYCLAPRQSGKSSLMDHFMKKLDSTQFQMIFIDLQEMASFNPSCLDNYNGFLKVLTTEILSNLSDLGYDSEEFEDKKSRNFKTLIQYIAINCNQRMIIFIDEIDQLLDTTFKDNFFGTIRAFFNKRTNDIYKKIQFVLSGAAQPSQLISKQYASPFNVGAPIILCDLSLEQVAEISKYLHDEPEKLNDELVSHIYKYTSGSVYLTQLLFEKLWKLAKTLKVDINLVNQVVEEIIDESNDNVHFLNIRSKITDIPHILQSFLSFVAGEQVDHKDIEYLKIAGITTGENVYRNLIYERVFGSHGPLAIVVKFFWVANFPKLVALDETVPLLVSLSAKKVSSHDLPITLAKGSTVNIIIQSQKQPQKHFIVVGKDEGKLVLSNEKENLSLQFKIKAITLGQSKIKVLFFYEGEVINRIEFDSLVIEQTSEEKSLPVKKPPIEDLSEKNIISLQQKQLGDLYFNKQQDWEKGHQSYAAALYENEMLYQASVLPENQQFEIQEMGTISVRNAYCLAKLGRFSEAIEVLERGKARTLGETLALDKAHLVKVSENDRTTFLATRKHISVLEAKARNSSTAHDLVSISSELRVAKEELSKIIERIKGYVPDFIKQELDFTSIVEIINSVGQPLVYLCTVTHGSLAFIIPPNITEITDNNVLWLDDFNETVLNNILEKFGYLPAITLDTIELTTILDETWPLLEKIMQPIAERLNDFGYKRAVLISFGTLGLLPLPAVTSSEIIFSLIPSAQALEFAYQSAIRKAQLPHVLFAVGNPSYHGISTPFSQMEVEEIEKFFAPDSISTLVGQQATRLSTRKNIRGASYVHFSYGGMTFNTKEHLNSAILLTGNEKISLRDLLNGDLTLSTAYLVVLSSCQTGLVDLKVPDEAIGFPTGFLQAGVPCVISTLWDVHDLATTLLMIRFYQLHLQENLLPVQALHQAQSWLREVTGEVIVKYYEKLFLKSGKTDQESFRYMKHYQVHLDEKPFAHPYYWAGFVFSGV